MHHHRLVVGDDTEGQHVADHCGEQQDDTVHTVEGLMGQHQAVEHIEYRDEKGHLQVVDQKISHVGSRFDR